MGDEQLANQKQLDDLKSDLLRAINDLKELMMENNKNNKEDVKELRDKVSSSEVKIATLETVLATYRNAGALLMSFLVILQFLLKYVIK